jgi:hypothetical protein
MSDAAGLPIHLWQSVLRVFSQSNDTTSLGQGGTGIAKNTINETTLEAATGMCMRDACTCSFGILSAYLDAIRACACHENSGEISGEIPLRTPSNSSAPNAEEMVHCLLWLADLHPDDPYTTHLSISEFCDIISFLHARVLPIVPQVHHLADKLSSQMAVHTHENAIKKRVEDCPYFNPR